MVKVTRSMPAPESLASEAGKLSGSYKKQDVIDRLEQDFHGKCYLCEIKPVSDPQVEHLRPCKVGKYPERKFDWNNLFLVCPHCNNIKNQKRYDEDIIDCCMKDPEESVSFVFESDGPHAEAFCHTDSEAVNTVALAEEIFNKANTGLRVYASQVRVDGLIGEMKTLYRLLGDYKRLDKARKGTLLRMLKTSLSRESAYAAFKRNYVRQHKEDYPELQAFLL